MKTENETARWLIIDTWLLIQASGANSTCTYCFTLIATCCLQMSALMLHLILLLLHFTPRTHFYDVWASLFVQFAAMITA